jgi:NitT/TauT family transport system substrate-binding protein
MTVLLAACGGGEAGGSDGAGADGGSDVISVRWGTAGIVQTPAQSMYTSLPLVLGYWEDEGLDLEQLDFEGASAAAQALDAGQVDIAMFSTPPLFNIAARDDRSDLIGVFTNITRPFSAPAVPEDSDIETPADFEGKTIGVASLEHSQVPIVKAMCEEAGCDPESLTFVPVGQGAESVAALEAGRIDVLGLFDAAHATVENLGIELRTIESELLDPENVGFASTLNVRTADLEDETMREAFVRVCRAHAKALAFADENPEAAVRLHWEVYPESKPSGVDEDEALEQGITVLNSRMENMQPVDGIWGYATDKQIEGAMNLQVLAGELAEPVDIEKIWTDELLDEINDFDEEAIRKSAREWTP